MMLPKSLKYAALLAGCVLALACLTASADEKKDDKAPSGTWPKKDSDAKLEFSGKDELKISPHGKDELILVVCKYTIDKDGVVKAKIAELTGKDEVKDKAKGHLPVGLEFSFKWKVKGDAATMEDIKGENVEPIKSHLEGAYEAKK
jgi:hypothetical protein